MLLVVMSAASSQTTFPANQIRSVNLKPKVSFHFLHDLYIVISFVLYILTSGNRWHEVKIPWRKYFYVVYVVFLCIELFMKIWVLLTTFWPIFPFLKRPKLTQIQNRPKILNNPYLDNVLCYKSVPEYWLKHYECHFIWAPNLYFCFSREKMTMGLLESKSIFF